MKFSLRPTIFLRSCILLLLGLAAGKSMASDAAELVPEGFEAWTLQDQIRIIRDSAEAHGGYDQRSVAFCHLLLELSEQANDYKNQAYAAERLSFAYSGRGLTVEGRKYALLAYDVAARMEGTAEVVWALYRLTATEIDLGNYEEALNYANEALELSQSKPENEFKERPQEVMVSFSYNSLGEVFRRFGFPGEAIEAYEAALEVLGEEDSVDYATRRTLGHNLGLSYVDLGELALGEKYLEEFKIGPDEDWNALRFFEWQQAYTLLRRKRRDLDKALELLTEGRQKAKEVGYPKWEKIFMEMEVEIRTDMGQDEKALSLMQQTRELERELSGEKVQKQIALLGFQMELSRELDEKLILESQAANQNWMVGILVIVSLLVIGLLVFLYRSVLGSRRTTRLLARKNSRLDQLLEEKEMWMNLMAHDLKAPLHLIGGLAQMVGEADSQTRAKAVANIRKSAEQGTELISQLLELSNVESGNLPIDFKQVDFNQLTREIHADLSAVAGRKGINLELEAHPQAIGLRSDPVLVRRIVENLGSNALKFSAAGTTVAMGVTENGGSPAIFVRDQGPGISPEEQGKLFQKFVRLSPQPTAGESSTGLGLAIVGVLAEKLGACVEVQSAVGEGSTFTLVFGRVQTS